MYIELIIIKKEITKFSKSYLLKTNDAITKVNTILKFINKVKKPETNLLFLLD
jgi:hypothetical protein